MLCNGYFRNNNFTWPQLGRMVHQSKQAARPVTEQSILFPDPFTPPGWLRRFLLCPICFGPPIGNLLERGNRNATTEKILCTPTWLSDSPRDVVSRTRRRRNGLE